MILKFTPPLEIKFLCSLVVLKKRQNYAFKIRRIVILNSTLPSYKFLKCAWFSYHLMCFITSQLERKPELQFLMFELKSKKFPVKPIEIIHSHSTSIIHSFIHSLILSLCSILCICQQQQNSRCFSI